MSAATITVASTAAILALFGIAIKYGGAVELIAGYDADRVDDEAGLAAFVGTNLLLVAALSAVVAAVAYTDSFGAATTVWITYTVGVVLVAAWTVRGARRYETTR